MKRFFVLVDVSVDYECKASDIRKHIEPDLIFRYGRQRLNALRTYGIESGDEYRIEIVNTRTKKKVYTAPFAAPAKK